MNRYQAIVEIVRLVPVRQRWITAVMALVLLALPTVAGAVILIRNLR